MYSDKSVISPLWSLCCDNHNFYIALWSCFSFMLLYTRSVLLCVSGCTKLQCCIFFSSLPLFLTLILCYFYCLQSSHWGACKIINMFYQHYWYGEGVWVVVVYFVKTVLAPYICLDATVRHLCPILKCKCVMQKYHTTHSYIPWNSVFHISCQCWGISVTFWLISPTWTVPLYLLAKVSFVWDMMPCCIPEEHKPHLHCCKNWKTCLFTKLMFCFKIFYFLAMKHLLTATAVQLSAVNSLFYLLHRYC